MRGVSERRYAKGAYLCHRGDRLDYWTGIVTGLVKVSSIARDRQGGHLCRLRRGRLSGEGSILKNELRKYDLVAIRETHLLLMNRATFNWLYDNSVGFNRFLVRQLNERLAQFIAVTEYDRLLFEARVARHLSWLCNPILNPHVSGRIEITQEELALLAGVATDRQSRPADAPGRRLHRRRAWRPAHLERGRTGRTEIRVGRAAPDT